MKQALRRHQLPFTHSNTLTLISTSLWPLSHSPAGICCSAGSWRSNTAKSTSVLKCETACQEPPDADTEMLHVFLNVRLESRAAAASRRRLVWLSWWNDGFSFTAMFGDLSVREGQEALSHTAVCTQTPQVTAHTQRHAVKSHDAPS